MAQAIIPPPWEVIRLTALRLLFGVVCEEKVNPLHGGISGQGDKREGTETSELASGNLLLKGIE